MCYNIRHCSGMDNSLNLSRTANVIKAQQPDFVGLQEVDSCVSRSSNVDQAARLAQLNGMHSTFAAAIPLSKGKYGVALLSKEAPLSVRRIPMPSSSEDRVLLVCEFADCVVACTHLTLVEKELTASADTILKEAARWNKPFIIMGDWNSIPTSSFVKLIKKSFTMLSDNTKYTFPADTPTKTIDYIAVYKNNTAESATGSSFQVVEEPKASDHRPLVVDVTLSTSLKREELSEADGELAAAPIVPPTF